MRTRHPAIATLLAVAALAACATVAAPPVPARTTARSDEPRAAQALAGLLAAINSGDSAQVARFAERMYDPDHLAGSGGVPRAVQRWMEVHTLYGPL
ncbi:MAG TPA: hypothetical protein VFR37_09670, partial [Longimicrobium sp.]|nr:hypothetical protein [Longimicrobium sp.]